MKNVTFLGVEGSGKTVLTTALVNVFKEYEKEGWYLRPDTRESFRFLEQAPSSLDSSTMPHQTTALKRLAWSVQFDGQTVRTLDVLDYPGEIYRLAFLEAKDDPDPFAFSQRVEANKDDIDALLAHLMESDQVFVLFNPADAQDMTNNSANLDAVWVTNACLDYLHRLPNRPTITLLLTQVDRYVDLEKYEIDLDVYVAHHLPLIHRNFPGLDIVAVSAIGPANATFGIDSIILRCLFECEVVQRVVNSLKRSSEELYEELEKLSLQDNQFKTKDSYIGDRLERCRNLTAKLPWFVPVGQLKANGFCVDFDEMADVGAILSIFNAIDMKQTPEERISQLGVGREQLLEIKPTSRVGKRLRIRLLEECKGAEEKCERQIASRIRLRKWCNVAIIVLAILALCELGYIFWRMAV